MKIQGGFIAIIDHANILTFLRGNLEKLLYRHVKGATSYKVMLMR